MSDRESREQEARDIRAEAAEAGVPVMTYLLGAYPHRDVVERGRGLRCHGTTEADEQCNLQPGHDGDCE